MNSTSLMAAERQQRLLETLRTFGKISAAEAAADLETSTETIRKDLIILEQRGLLRRVHGGALHLESMTFEPDVASRQDNLDEKSRIAAAATRFLPEGGAVLIDAGSTARAVADHFPNRSMSVFTNALAIAVALLPLENVAVSTFGGRVRAATTAEVGAVTVAAINQMHFDVAIVGTNAISAEHGLATPDQEEAAIKAAMIRNSAKVVLLADHTKFAQRSLVRYADVSDIDVVVTGQELESPHRRSLDEVDVEVVFA
ncbi:DeoR/GlpR family DNA-binding transcription regulator [Paramicrobacterium chengjingii]|uniref:Lactose phosphotransferase system repressor n=1 Tax=Paramicrobacterium chengjingii TaxID=2769067 RepID=A0ABX6YJA1_9MICO|nr:DeoR/GlpR family DNA-binding transcription regulator [Microbacterium chengjingii]QPZ38872.1 DeoR/GlpR transcriptional regulator [Microbacterium chengjingii]